MTWNTYASHSSQPDAGVQFGLSSHQANQFIENFLVARFNQFTALTFTEILKSKSEMKIRFYAPVRWTESSQHCVWSRTRASLKLLYSLETKMHVFAFPWPRRKKFSFLHLAGENLFGLHSAKKSPHFLDALSNYLLSFSCQPFTIYPLLNMKQ